MKNYNCLFGTFLLVFSAAGVAIGQDKNDAEDQTKQVTEAANSINRLQRFTFRHNLNEGEQIRWSVEHIATVKTKIGEHDEHLSSRTNSTKLWKVIEVDSRGNMTLQNSVEKLNLWNKVGEEAAISYDSEKDKEIPPMFKTAASNVGVVLATVTIDPMGRLVNRNSDQPESSFGSGGITIPFPEQPIGIGHKWSVPGEFTAKHGDGRVQQIKSRRLYELVSVENQIAVIDVKTQILTPIEEPKIRSQIIQKMNKGSLKFDLTAGRLIYQEIDWNEQVQGFEGEESNLEYMARLTESIVVPRVSKRESVNNDAEDVVIKPTDGKPILRSR